ncbi:tyrosine-type recombinase/integrase [Acinetobacter puyangensis]|uniref:Integrase n=1 Tax=Acinetobacter puyangensis TaxID=1096779 RepID=A0A240E8L5_9GAMM|nr:integrase arm-type DNA-binding domain-containing protein [Acinetobacter puyangensis]SNX44559.1 Integrase [Acinetobacter puyangensis]
MRRSEIKKRPISDTALSSLKPELYEYREHDGNGLYFRVKPNGKKSWQLRYKKTNGKWSWLGIGPYPEISGQIARQKAIKLRDSMTKTTVEVSMLYEEQFIPLTPQNNCETFEHLTHEWLSGKANKWTHSTMIRHCGALQNHILPVMGKRDYRGIKPVEWFNLFKMIQTEKKIIEQSNRIYRLCHDIYDLAKVTDRIDYNPLEGIHKHIAKARSKNLAHIPIHELPILLQHIKNYPQPEISIALQLLIMLFPRPSELRLAQWKHFNLEDKVWIRPAEFMKKRIEHGIPLPFQAIKLLKRLRKYSGDSPYLLPGCVNRNKPRSDKVFVNALKKLGYAGQQTPHGFRHIASTILNNEFDDREQVVEACLAHLKSGVKGTYDKGSHFNARIHMMQWYADYLDDKLINYIHRCS